MGAGSANEAVPGPEPSCEWRPRATLESLRLQEPGVPRVVGWYKLGLPPEEIAERIGHLSLAQVHAALTYYHANQRQIDEEIAADDTAAETLEREHLAARTAIS